MPQGISSATSTAGTTPSGNTWPDKLGVTAKRISTTGLYEVTLMPHTVAPAPKRRSKRGGRSDTAGEP